MSTLSQGRAPVQLSKLAGINLADDITGLRHSFIFISVLFLVDGGGPNDISSTMANVTALLYQIIHFKITKAEQGLAKSSATAANTVLKMHSA